MQRLKIGSKKFQSLLIIKTFIFNRESKENGDLYGSIKPRSYKSD